MAQVLPFFHLVAVFSVRETGKENVAEAKATCTYVLVQVATIRFTGRLMLKDLEVDSFRR